LNFLAYMYMQALERTGVSVDDVNYVNAHGTSTPVGDMAEYRCHPSTRPLDLKVRISVGLATSPYHRPELWHLYP
jgi:3-oxoacyl-(acyl-carrier-protein) synthase